jgi:hypothetical protein
MKRASGSTAPTNPVRGQPVNLWRNTGLCCARARVAKKHRNRSASHGIASPANRSRDGSVTMGETSRASAR